MTEAPLLSPGAAAPSGGWRRGVVRAIAHPAPRAVVLRLEVDDRVVHVPGQHYVVRLTADDGYAASRSYSVASAPDDPLVELYVERLEDGEVSSFLADVVEVGDELEVRGPIGGWFAWDGVTPALGIGGGTGVVPLVSMLRHARGSVTPSACASSPRDVGRRAALRGGDRRRVRRRGALARGVAHGTSARSAGGLRHRPAPRGTRGRLRVRLRGFRRGGVELLVSLGVAETAIRVERFGPSA